jgi:hypothetical protein
MLNRDSNLVDLYGAWLGAFRWDLFGTLTFDPGRSLNSAASRRKALTCYLSALERHCRARVRCFWAEEKRWSGCGLPAIAPHFHVLLACDRGPLTPLYPQALWENSGGKADMRIYDPALNGVVYCAKLIASTDAQYDFVNFPQPVASGVCKPLPRVA